MDFNFFGGQTAHLQGLPKRIGKHRYIMIHNTRKILVMK